MVSHIVLLKARPDLAATDRQALISAFERAVRDIASVKNVRIGTRVRHGAPYEIQAPDAADYLVVLDFDDLEGLQTYLRHPSHAELGVRFGQALSSAVVYDFAVGGIEELSRLR